MQPSSRRCPGGWWIADPASPQNRPRTIRYPAAGTANADVSLHVLRTDGTRTEVALDRSAFEYLARADWDAHGPLLSVQSRDQRTVRILAADPESGTTSLLHEERDPARSPRAQPASIVPGSGCPEDTSYQVPAEPKRAPITSKVHDAQLEVTGLPRRGSARHCVRC
jgi:hypothetical protein